MGSTSCSPRKCSLPMAKRNRCGFHAVWRIRKNVDLRIAVLRRLVQFDGDATRAKSVSPFVSQCYTLLINHPRFSASHLAPLADRFPWHVLGVLPDEEGCVLDNDLQQKHAGAKVAVADPWRRPPCSERSAPGRGACRSARRCRPRGAERSVSAANLWGAACRAPKRHAQSQVGCAPVTF